MEENELRDKAKELYLSGVKQKDIATELDMSINTLKAWIRRHGWSKNKGAPEIKKNAPQKNKGAPIKEVQLVIENDDLTEQQKMFCLFYLQHFNATKAYQQAYGCDYRTANVNGSRLLVNASIKKELHRLKAELQQDTFVDVKDLIQEYVKQAFADINDVITSERKRYKAFDALGKPIKDEDGNQVYHYYNTITAKNSDEFDGSLVKSISQGKDGVSVTMYDSQKAMAELMKYLDVDALKQAQTEKAQAEAAIIKNKAAKLTGGGKASELLQALLDVKSGGNGNGDNLQREAD